MALNLLFWWIDSIFIPIFFLQNSLSETETSKADNEKELQQQITALQKQLDQLSKDKNSSEAKLTGDLDTLHKRLLGKTYLYHWLDSAEILWWILSKSSWLGQSGLSSWYTGGRLKYVDQAQTAFEVGGLVSVFCFGFKISHTMMDKLKVNSFDLEKQQIMAEIAWGCLW